MRKGKMLVAMLLAAVMGFFASSVGITVSQIPGEMTVHTSGSARLATFLPVEVEYSPSPGAEDTAAARLFGLFKLKAVSVNVEAPRKVILGGNVFGVRMYSDGVMVVGLAHFTSEEGTVNPAAEAGIQKGDVIKSANGVQVYTNKELADIVKNSSGAIKLELVDASSGKRKSTLLTPKYSIADRSLKTGMWVRDSAAGIGTLTYIDPQTMTFGGLGHGICDSDTQSIVPVCEGDIVQAHITDIRRGVKGAAGEVKGYLGNDKLGEIKTNTVCGAFGRYTANVPETQEYEVAMKQEIRTGKAQIFCTLAGDEQPKLYDIEINKINYSGNEPAKNMMITVTDKELLSRTGGIIQGMSGSPIIQNGKFVGAVTHVFVNDPTCGYAVFAENMLKQGDRAAVSE